MSDIQHNIRSIINIIELGYSVLIKQNLGKPV